MTLTIFTPTYNRAYILPQLYRSLYEQSCKSFVWLIVDDGSTDNTKELVKRWQKEANFEIIYYYQENGGKMRAHNSGVKLCTTDLFMCIDSDDQALPNAVEEVLCLSKLFTPKTAAAAAARLMNKDIKTPWPNNVKHCTMYELGQKYGFHGETTLVYRTDILRMYPFPEIEGEKFITEAYVYFQIDKEGYLLLGNKSLVQCEYQPDGYSLNEKKLFANNPRGYAMYWNLLLTLPLSLKEKIVAAAKYNAFCKRAGLQNFISQCNNPILSLMVLPITQYYYNKLFL